MLSREICYFPGPARYRWNWEHAAIFQNKNAELGMYNHIPMVLDITQYAQLPSPNRISASGVWVDEVLLNVEKRQAEPVKRCCGEHRRQIWLFRP